MASDTVLPGSVLSPENWQYIVSVLSGSAPGKFSASGNSGGENVQLAQGQNWDWQRGRGDAPSYQTPPPNTNLSRRERQKMELEGKIRREEETSRSQSEGEQRRLQIEAERAQRDIGEQNRLKRERGEREAPFASQHPWAPRIGQAIGDAAALVTPYLLRSRAQAGLPSTMRGIRGAQNEYDALVGANKWGQAEALLPNVNSQLKIAKDLQSRKPSIGDWALASGTSAGLPALGGYAPHIFDFFGAPVGSEAKSVAKSAILDEPWLKAGLAAGEGLGALSLGHLADMYLQKNSKSGPEAAQAWYKGALSEKNRRNKDTEAGRWHYGPPEERVPPRAPTRRR